MDTTLSPSTANTAEASPVAPVPGLPPGVPGLRSLWAQGLLALCITGLSIGAYDKLIRQPSTPRLAVVDVAKLYAEAERLATQRALEMGARAGGAELAGTSAEFAGAARAAADFGPALEQLLRTVSGECRCAVVAMAAVYGADATVPDFTAEVAQRLRTSMPGRVDGQSAPSTGNGNSPAQRRAP